MSPKRGGPAPLLDPAEARRRLAALVPFRYLRREEIEALAAEAELRSYLPGESLLRQGEEASREVFVLLAGSVESVDLSRNPPFRLNVVESGSYFGERGVLLGRPPEQEVRALEPAAAYAIPGELFLGLLSASIPFAQAVGTKLRDGLGLFEAFDRFNAELLRGVALGHIEVRRLVELYKALEPALHPLLGEEGRIDWGALSYAIRRLPENLTRCFVFLLTDNLPTVYAGPELLFPAVETEARHRFVYEMMPGKDMVLVRSGMSDLVDFLTCLCLFAVEARKIRYRLNHPDRILALARLGAGGADSGSAELLASFGPEEVLELEALWPGRAAERVREIVFHRQVYSVDVRKQVNNFNGTLGELWARQVGEAAESLLGTRPADFPGELEVHLVSSNTHSVSNCLNPFYAESREDILAWAEAEGLRVPGWPSPYDEAYHLARPWLAAFPERARELARAEAEAGILRLPETVTTGIQVQLIDASRVCSRPVDPGIEVRACARSSLIVNIDYAFGEQAEEVMRSLLLLFGRNVRSINVIGKAGALLGARGDVLLPTAFIEQASDGFLPLAPADGAALGRLGRALPGRGIHAGPLLTVGGTLLQNRAMLEFYRRIRGCVGLEMEGIFYLRAILEAEELGVLRAGARRRFFYYVSDLPLSPAGRLSSRLGPLEGVPPLYAVTRELLSGVFGGS